MTTRRRFLGRTLGLGAGAIVGSAMPAVSRMAWANTAAADDARLVFILLRGALDGLSAVPPHGDPAYAALRREIAIGRPGTPQGALALDATFGLHPSLGFLHECYQAREAIVLHAVATPYRERSHFDGQDVLENGGVRPHELQSGWLNRAIAALPAPGPGREAGIALGQNVPLAMRGPAEVASWSPSKLASLDDDTLQRIADLYAKDPLLSRRLADALATDDIAREGTMMSEVTEVGGGLAKRATPGAARYAETVRAAGSFLARADGPQVAMLDTTGWDTHANEGGAQGQLATRLVALDAGLAELKGALGAKWKRTMIVIATEFGRTAEANGTRGTDHGTGAAAFIVGGAVPGGRVVADWPGLSPRELHEGRDLRATLDLRSVLKGVLGSHLGISAHALDTQVFPGSADVAALSIA